MSAFASANRVKIIPSSGTNAANLRLATSGGSGTSQDTHSVCIQFALHGLVPRSAATPPSRTLFFCIASDQLFPTAKALQQVCADPVDFSRICAKQSASVPRPDFVSGYTKALPVAQYGADATTTGSNGDAAVVDGKPKSGGAAAAALSTSSKPKGGGDSRRSPSPEDPVQPRWVFVAEARVMVSENMMASLLGETDQRFVVLYTSASFQRSAGGKHGDASGGHDGGLRESGSVIPEMGAGGRSFLPRFAGEALAQPLRPSSAAGTDGRKPAEKPEWTTLMHSPGSRHPRPSSGAPSTGRAASVGSSSAATADGSGGSPISGAAGMMMMNTHTVLSREQRVSCVELSGDLLEADLHVQLGPQDRSWLFRFSAAGRRRWQHASFDAARQLCSHRMHLGAAGDTPAAAAQMLRQMAHRFNTFLVAATQDSRRFCSFHAARMKVPIVFERGMRAPQCQVFLQFLRESRRFVVQRCIPEPPPHLVAHVAPPEFLEEKPLLEVIADLSLRFFTGDEPPLATARRGSVAYYSGRRRSIAAAAAAAAQQEKGGLSDSPAGSFSAGHGGRGAHANFGAGGTYGPEVRSVFAPWRIEWLDYLLLVCVETRLWIEIGALLERFFELSDAQLLRHPEYVQEEHLLRINLFANVADIERATGHGLQLDEAVRVASRTAAYCKASPANRALVLRIRHMTRIPYFQRVLFDPALCMFEELCPSAARATVGRILWCVLVPLSVQKKVTAVIGARDNGVPMVTTPTVAARQYRAFVHVTSIGDDAMRAMMKRVFCEWVNHIRRKRQKRKEEMQLAMTVKTAMNKNADSRKMYFRRWLQGTLKAMAEKKKRRF